MRDFFFSSVQIYLECFYKKAIYDFSSWESIYVTKILIKGMCANIHISFHTSVMKKKHSG